jgi:lipopolysaccharide transport system ATP-binding protein
VPIIKVKGISMKYQLGHIVSHKKLINLFQRCWQRLMGNPSQEEVIEDYWALKDINLEVQQGEAVGIIGKNGAGKSNPRPAPH